MLDRIQHGPATSAVESFRDFMPQNFDIVLLGTGPSSSRIAEACAKKFRVAVVDKRAVGGECALRGCNPKKVFVRAAELVDRTKRSQGKLIGSCDATIDWPTLIAFKRTFTDPVPPKTREKYEQQGITVFQDAARFIGSQTLAIGDQQITADRIVICTGANPAPLNIEGEDLLTYSDEFMEPDELPQRLLFVGGGYISFEFAHVAARAGADVTIIDRNPRPLKGFEPDLVDRLVDYSRSIGIEVELNTEIRRIDKSSGGECIVTVATGDDERQVIVDAVLHGAGRAPSIDGLDLDAANIEADEHGIRVNEFLQSVSNPHVYAAGDVVASDQPKLTPVANQQGRVVSLNLRGRNKHKPDYGVVPKVVFTVPALASIGLTEEQATERNLNFEIRGGDMSNWTSIKKIGADCAAYKVLVDKQSDRILGAHLLAPDAAETINLFAFAMKFQHTAKELKSVLFTFPTFCADVRNMI